MKSLDKGQNMDNESMYQKKMAAQLQEWSAQISLLEAKMGNAAAGVRLHQSDELKALRARQLAATEKMHELGRSTGDAWKQVKLTADKLWDELRDGLSAAQDKFK
jgi:hypothetical protein